MKFLLIAIVIATAELAYTIFHELAEHSSSTLTFFKLISFTFLVSSVTVLIAKYRSEASSAKQKAEESIKNSLNDRNLCENLLENMPCAIVSVDPDFVLRRVNKQVYHITGFDPDKMIGKKCYDFFGMGKVCIGCPVQKSLESGQVNYNVKQEVDSKGNEIFIHQTAIPIFNKDKSIDYVLEVVIDVTNQKKLEYLNSKLYKQMVISLAHLIESRDEYTGSHSLRVREIAVEIGRELNLDSNIIQELSIAAELHDIGKIGIPESILNKPGKLSNLEYDIIKQHPILGYNALKNIDQLVSVSEAILYHHERFDGTGYPTGKSGVKIPIIARILTIADVYEAITSNRIYRNAMTQEKAVEVMEDGRGSHFDPEILDVFFSILRRKDKNN
ncbi:HD domain-containing phosphohydrolase [Dendrosporobacter sp. 1207_IL3150]|uniref:HD domain-containing phosphohydrolase n=1 Tax=Dendrosporobacter sp. 1207_IL3150 TaxID=3084054 RepID=UPI002FD9503C